MTHEQPDQLMIGPSCSECAYWLEFAAQTDDPLFDHGECHRHAPFPHMSLNNRPPKSRSRWPITESEDFCGDAQPRWP